MGWGWWCFFALMHSSVFRMDCSGDGGRLSCPLECIEQAFSPCAFDISVLATNILQEQMREQPKEVSLPSWLAPCEH